MRTEGIGHLKIFKNHTETGTSRLVAQYSNHLRHLSPRIGLSTMNYRVFFFCLTLKRRPNSLPDALPAMNRTPLVGEVQQSMAGARQTITEITNYRKYNKNSLERRAGAHLTSRETNNHIHKSFSAEAD